MNEVVGKFLAQPLLVFVGITCFTGFNQLVYATTIDSQHPAVKQMIVLILGVNHIQTFAEPVQSNGIDHLRFPRRPVWASPIAERKTAMLSWLGWHAWQASPHQPVQLCFPCVSAQHIVYVGMVFP